MNDLGWGNDAAIIFWGSIYTHFSYFMIFLFLSFCKVRNKIQERSHIYKALPIFMILFFIFLVSCKVVKLRICFGL